MLQSPAMKHAAYLVVLLALASGVIGAQSEQTARPAQPAQPKPSPQTPTADPYANNPEAGKTQFPLAAPAGKDSGAKTTAPAGATNQGAFDPARWQYGTAFNAPAGSKIWNPAKLKLMQGGKVTGGTVFAATDPSTYCAFANA